jgi:uncharacterized membrane protein YedE/YeeE
MSLAAFHPLPALAGGALIGLAAAGMWWLCGRIAGVSNLLGSAIGAAEGRGWRLSFLGGLAAAGVLAIVLFPERIAFTLEAGFGQVILAGLLVGFGTQLGSGCTSGHGVCGIGRLSLRSLTATLAFMASGFVTVLVLKSLST